MTIGLFDAMATALAPMLGRSVAPFTLSRLLMRARLFEREALTAAQVRGAMPTIEAGLAELLTPGELREATGALATVLDAASAGPADPMAPQRTDDATDLAPRRRPPGGTFSARAPWWPRLVPALA